jgi:hypothetical protein
MSNGLARKSAAPAARSSLTVSGFESPLRMTTGIAAGAADFLAKPFDIHELLAIAVIEQDEARLVVDRRRDAVAAGHGGAQLDVGALALEQTLDDQDVVRTVVDVQHDAVHGIGAVREAGPAWRSGPAATESSSRPSSVRSSGLVR